MKKRALFFILLTTVLALLNCKPTKKSTASESTASPATTAAATNSTTSEADMQMAIVQSRWPSSTTEEIKEGQVIYTTKCTSCHKAYNIPRFSEAKWLHEIDEMSPKARLTETEKLKLTKYILSYRETKQKLKGN